MARTELLARLHEIADQPPSKGESILTLLIEYMDTCGFMYSDGAFQDLWDAEHLEHLKAVTA